MVATFKVDEDTGTLTVVGWESTQGEIPSGISLDQSGSFPYAGYYNGTRTRNHLVQAPVPVDIEFGAPV